MSETPLATMSQVGDEGDARPASTDGTPDTTSDTTPAVHTNAPISEADYEAIADAVMETERGRWFLKEYARRNRNADTQTVLDALERLEDRIATNAPSGSDTSVALISHNVIDLAEAITQVKREVQELGGQGDDKDHFNSATEELEAIVSQTETATGEILEAAEKIQEVLWTLREEGANETQCDIIESKIIDVYTACSFQDLTGQRSSKVVRLVGYVEKRVSAMMDILGLSSKEGEVPASSKTKASSKEHKEAPTAEAYQEGDGRSDAHLLHGPALEGEGIEQDDVDALFGGGDTVGDSVDTDEAKAADALLTTEPEEQAENEPAEAKLEAAASDAVDVPDEPDTQVKEDQLEPDLPEPDLPDAQDISLETLAKEASEEEASIEDNDTSDEVDIITGDMVVELHDAEILRRPSEDALIKDALTKSTAAQDIFDVETLDFDGPDMGQRGPWDEAEETASEVQSPRDDRKVLVNMTDDFVVDEGVADMFVDSGPKQADRMLQASSQSDNAGAEQDIFDVDEFAFDEPTDINSDSIVDGHETLDDAISQDTTDDTKAPSALDMAETESEESVLDHAMSELETALAEEQKSDQSLTAEPTHADNTNSAEDEAEPVPYTDEERIALFS
ncbi:MAG: hypothetical protein RIC24_15825 [Hyphomicrobiales bacterium]|jgi:chemotaxis protein CheZ